MVKLIHFLTKYFSRYSFTYAEGIKMMYELGVLTVLVFIVDSIFLYSMKDVFNREIKSVQGHAVKFNYEAVITSYLSIVFLLYWFVLRDKKSIEEAFILGHLTYGIFEYTNLAIFDNWSTTMSVIDNVWGGILFMIVSFIYYRII